MKNDESRALVVCIVLENRQLKDENEFAKERIRALSDQLRAARNCETGCYVDELREVEKENAELRKWLEMAVKDIERRCGTCAHNHNGDCSERSGRACRFWKWRGAKESEANSEQFIAD